MEIMPAQKNLGNGHRRLRNHAGNGRALGLVMSLPEGDRYSKSKSKLLSELTMAMGGRAAEEIIFGADKVSSGASGDIKMATDQARRMVTTD